MDEEYFIGLRYFTQPSVEINSVEIAEVTYGKKSGICRDIIYVQGLFVESNPVRRANLIGFRKEEPIGTKLERRVIPLESIVKYIPLKPAEEKRL